MENIIKTKSDFFYTDVQIDTLKHSIFRGDKLVEASTRYAAQFHKSQNAVYAKMCILRRQLKDSPESIVEQKTATISVEQGITLPEGFLFEGVPSKVMILKDHFRIYF